MKRNLLILCLIGLIGFFAVGISSLVAKGTDGGTAEAVSRYNTDPDVADKIIGSENMRLFIVPFYGMEELAAVSQVIVQGYVCDEPVEIDVLTESPIRGEYTYPVTMSTIKVEKVYKGDVVAGEELPFRQYGRVGVCDMETKVLPNEKMMFFLRGSSQDYYVAYRFETGLFKLESTGKKGRGLFGGQESFVTESLSKEYETSKYDGINVSVLEEDIAELVTETAGMTFQEKVTKYYGHDLVMEGIDE